jgi:hypothetical protein
MNFTERMEAMEEELQELCKRGVVGMVRRRVEGRSEPMLQDLLLQSTVFQDAYKTAFDHHFEGVGTDETASALRVAADNLGYSLSAFLRSCEPDYSLDKLLVFLETMLSIQLAHFETWCVLRRPNGP